MNGRLFTRIMSKKLLCYFDKLIAVFDAKQDFIAKDLLCCG